MSLFNPIQGQYERLSRALDDRKTIPLHDAAQAMRVKEGRVDRSLLEMTKKGFFGENRPYVDDELRTVVIDPRYAAYARVMAAAEHLIDELESARTKPAAMTAAAQSKANSGGFLAALFRPPVKIPDTSSAVGTMIELSEYANRLRTILLGHPEAPYDPAMADWLDGAMQTVIAWENCLEGAYADGKKSDTMRRLERTLSTDYLAVFPTVLTPPKRSVPKSEENELRQQCLALTKMRGQVSSLELQLSLDRICGLLNQINAAMEGSGVLGKDNALTSLRGCYLPLVQKLANQFIRYEKMPQKNDDTIRAMDNTLTVLGKDVPLALSHMLSNLQSGSAIHMDAEATALKQKLRLDGLLPPLS